MKFLFIRFSSIGDILLTTPIVKAIKNKFKNANIDYLLKEQYAQLISYNPDINNLIKYKNSFSSLFQLQYFVKNSNYDYIIDLQSKLNSCLIKTLSLNSYIITYQKKHFHRLLLTKPKLSRRISPINSTVDLYGTILKYFSIKKFEKKIYLYLPNNTEKIISSYNIKDTKLKIVISPGASYKTKQYPAKYYADLINMIKAKFDYSVILIGNKNEKKLTDEISKRSKYEIINLCGKTNLLQAMVIINKADIFISGDCGPMHIAAAFQKPQITIFGSTHPVLGFSPLNQNATIIQNDIECRPCSLHGFNKCPRGHLKCMLDILPGEIFETLIEKIKIIKKLWT